VIVARLGVDGRVAMSLRHALMALLRVGAMSGYELQKQFSQSVGHVWHAPDSQIYPELRRMEAEGLVEAEVQQRGDRATRRLYHVTDAGDRAFLEWMSGPLEYQRVKDPAHLRSAYLETVSADVARAFFQRHIDVWSDEREQWLGERERIISRSHPMLMRRLAATPEADHERTVAFKRHTYEGLVERAEAEIRWARRGLELLDDLEG